MDRRRNSDVLFYALQCAKSDRLAFIDAYRDMGECQEVKDANLDIVAFERMQRKLFGTTRSKMDSVFDDGISLSLSEIRKHLTKRETDKSYTAREKSP